MEVFFFLLPWLLIGAGVIYFAFRGGPSQARQARAGGGGAFRIFIVVLYLAFGIAVPALVIANREEAVGSGGSLASEAATGQIERGKQLFADTCASCHTLEEANAQGNTGPNLDEIGALNKERVLGAIKNGGTGQKRMPAGLLDGANADAVAAYVEKVSGR